MRAEQGNRGKQSHIAWIALSPRESEEKGDLICCTRVRSRAWIITGSGIMAASALLSVVLMRSFWKRASAGAIHVPGMTCQQISKSCKNNNQWAC